MRKKSLASQSERRVSEALKNFIRSALREHGEKVLSIVLFGSRARGDHTCYSDVDVFVVLSESKERFLDRLSDFVAYCQEGLVEALIYTKDEVEAMFASRNPFLLDVLHEGIPLFDRGFWGELKSRFAKLVEKGLVKRCNGGWRIKG